MRVLAVILIAAAVALGFVGCGGASASVVVAAPASVDALDWMDSKLPATQFVGVEAFELRSGKWASVGAGIQPFRSKTSASAAFWRKDDRALDDSWYGEIWTFDDSFVYLHTETFPQAYVGESWDQRPDRFRLFRNHDDPTRGRVMMPRKLTPGWSYSQTIDTFICGQSGNGFDEYRSGKCAPYQRGVEDAVVRASVVDHFELTAPITASAQTPPGAEIIGELPSVWDRVLVIEQFMRSGDGFARERFFMGYHAGTYYGLIAWDASSGPTMDGMTIEARTIPTHLMRRDAGAMTFDGMAYRVDQEHAQ